VHSYTEFTFQHFLCLNRIQGKTVDCFYGCEMVWIYVIYI